MRCPRCGNEWDPREGSCTTCGFTVRLRSQSEPMTRNFNPQRGNAPSGGLPSVNQQSDSNSPVKQQVQSGRLPPLSQPPRTTGSGSMHPIASMPIPPRGSTLASNPLSPSNSPLPKPAFEKNVLQKMPTGRETNPSQPLPQTEAPGSNIPSMKSPWPRAQAPAQSDPSLDRLVQNTNRPPLSTSLPLQSNNPDGKAQLKDRQQAQPSPTAQQPNAFTSNPSLLGVHPLLPGVLLRGGRYRLQELRERQDWLSGAFEATWTAQDAHRAGSQVMICEVVLPENTSLMTQSILRTATMSLASVGRHPRIPTLWDAFSDQGRSFFVFEPIEGESLLTRMRRTGHALPEQEVIECCLQMTEVLELLAQQSPPLVHGLIRPGHINRNDSQFVLTNFSIVLAGGANQFVSGIDRSRLSPYTAPEVGRGVIDVRTDLFSLVATAYHAATGSVPTGVSGSIPSAQRINPGISARFDAILTKGLRPVASQRYQRPSELRQELLAIRSVSSFVIPEIGVPDKENTTDFAGNRGSASRKTPAISPKSSTLASKNGQRSEQGVPRVPDTVEEALPALLAQTQEIEDRPMLLPRPEDLPAIKEGNDWLNAGYWLAGILACLILIVVLSHVLS